MKNFQIGDILRYNRGDNVINYFLIIDREEISSSVHHAGYFIQYKIKNMSNEQTATLSSDNKLMDFFVRENE